MARAGRAAYRAAVVAAARGLRDHIVPVAESRRQGRASEVVSPPSPRPSPKLDAALPPIRGGFITTKPDVSGPTRSPDAGMPECGRGPATPVSADDSALLHVLQAYIEILKAESEILKRQLAAAEARAAREAAKAEWAIGEFSALARRLTTRAAERDSCG